MTNKQALTWYTALFDFLREIKGTIINYSNCFLFLEKQTYTSIRGFIIIIMNEYMIFYFVNYDLDVKFGKVT